MFNVRQLENGLLCSHLVIVQQNQKSTETKVPDGASTTVYIAVVLSAGSHISDTGVTCTFAP